MNLATFGASVLAGLLAGFGVQLWAGYRRRRRPVIHEGVEIRLRVWGGDTFIQMDCESMRAILKYGGYPYEPEQEGWTTLAPIPLPNGHIGSLDARPVAVPTTA